MLPPLEQSGHSAHAFADRKSYEKAIWGGERMAGLFDLSTDVAVVIGGTGGLGGGHGGCTGGSGGSYRRSWTQCERGAQRVAEIESAGGKAIFQSADALDPASLAAARDAIESQLGNVTILINAAGGNRPDATLPPGSDFANCR